MSSGRLFVIAAPSGAGKTSLVNALLDTLDDIKISISYTTRPKRPSDQEGVTYYFVSEHEFSEMIGQQAFLEYAEVYGYHYGTSNEWVVQQLQQGIDVILEIDWQGAEQIKRLFPTAVLIFILPPSSSELKQRLEKRSEDQPETILQRMANVKDEVAHYHEFDYLIVNDQFDQALADLRSIVSAERLRCAIVAKRLTKLLAGLIKKQ